MAILLDHSARVIIQGITGRIGKVFSARMARHYATFCGGVRPGGGGTIDGKPIFPSVAEAVDKVGANTSVVVVPGPGVKAAALEAIEAGIKLIWIYTDGVPVHDAMFFINYAILKGVRIIGPNAAGIVSPGKASASELNEDQLGLKPGSIGIISKSGSLCYEVVDMLRRDDYGFSTVVCIGGDVVCGTTFSDLLPLFAEDAETEAVIMLGEIGGSAEVDGARLIPSLGKPLIGYVAGWHAPRGKKMGHAAAIISREEDTAAAKSALMERHGAHVAASLEEIGALVRTLV
jgi:succinyl-CoA synthetase alpha subunit